MNQEFNLIDEPWICVRLKDCTVKEVGLKELFFHAQDYAGLAGETKTQDFAILRLLLAVMHTVFARYDTQGNKVDRKRDINLPMRNWKTIWKDKQIPQEPINDYFETWRDRFWLFDDKYPFYQLKEVRNETVGHYCTTAKIIGSLVESGNKFRLFTEQVGYMGDKARIIPLSYAQAARWLINLQCFDDTAAKDGGGKPPKPPWAAEKHLIAIEGDNLFETLMLNYVADYKGNHKVSEFPAWEWTEEDRIDNFPPNGKKGDNKILKDPPDNQAELLTWQSRCVHLDRNNDEGPVIGCYIAGGAYFEEEDLFLEQMVLWEGKKGQFKPQKYDRSRLVWQEFGSIVSNAEDGNTEKYRRPGVIEWFYKRLKEKEIIEQEYMLKTMNAATIYTSKAGTTTLVDLVSDSLNFQAKLLLDGTAKEWRVSINNEIDKCNEAAQKVADLSIDLQKAAGASGDNIKGDEAKREFYHRIDSTFRLWLAELKVNDTDDAAVEQYMIKLDTDLRKIALRLGKEMVAQVSDKAIFGYIKLNDDKNKNKKTVFSAAEAINKYELEINKIFPKK